MLDSAEVLQSSLLRAAGFRHAFFTRRGGVSTGPYESLNFSISVGDDPENVAENFRRAASALGVTEERLFFLSQVHGANVEVLSESDVHGTLARAAMAEREGDALATNVTGVVCGVRTADCVPILVADRRSGAVVAIHAGWRGVVRGVVAAGVRRLRELSGATGNELVAAIGPHIGPTAFEVGEDVALELERVAGGVAAVDRRGTKPLVALAPIVRQQLRQEGLSDTAVDEVPGCTFSDRDRFFSFRRDGKVGGRHYSAIVARPPSQ
jgi:YfiH family protein